MKKVQIEVKKYLKNRGWLKLRPADVAKSISIESAELLELFQWSNPSVAELKEDTEKMHELKKELADIMIYCLDMAVVLGIDAQEAVKEKLKYIRKKYPATEMRKGVANKRYWEIKKKYRMDGK